MNKSKLNFEIDFKKNLINFTEQHSTTVNKI